MSVGIYKITSPNGEIYIGQSINIEKRWKTYYWQFSTKRLKAQIKLYLSFKEYGYENHIFEIVEEMLGSTRLERLHKEKYYKILYDSVNNGLNCKYEDGGVEMTDNVRLKIGLGNKGKTVSNKTREKLSKIHINNKNMLGKKHSEETKKKMSEKHKGKILTQEHINNIKKSTKGILKTQEWKDKISNNHSMNKPIIQYDLEGNFIKEWPSAKTASKSNSKWCYSTICKCASGGLKSSGGYKWKYKNF
jgi:group I intron endonuclease